MTMLDDAPVVRERPVVVRNEPLTYEEHGRCSYFQDLVRAHVRRDPAAEARLARHAAEMRVLTEIRDAQSTLELRRSGVEYRVTPSAHTVGQGGYFGVPLWLNQAFATAPRTPRVLAALVPNFALPANVATINVPFLPTGTTAAGGVDNSPVPDSDLADGVASSNVVTIDGKTDVSVQMLDQSPPGAVIDWVVFSDLSEAYDQQLETQLLVGTGSANGQLVGVTTQSAIQSVVWNNAGPTDVLFYAQLGQVISRVGNNRKRPPEALLMRTARWAWTGSSPDGASRPYVLPRPWSGGTADLVIQGVGDVLGFPVYLDDAIPANLGVAQNQDLVIGLRPSDLIVFEGAPQTSVLQEVLSGSLQVRLLYRRYVAAITGRRQTGIAVLSGTGMILPAAYAN